jgi:hypothetical protein
MLFSFQALGLHNPFRIHAQTTFRTGRGPWQAAIRRSTAERTLELAVAAKSNFEALEISRLEALVP